MPNLVLRLCGFSDEDVALFVSREALAAEALERGYPLALAKALLTLAFKLVKLLWKIAAPYVLFRQVLTVFVLQFTHEAIIPWIKYLVKLSGLRGTLQESPEVIRLRQEAEAATTYEQWRDASRALEMLIRKSSAKASDTTDDAFETDRIQRMIGKTQLYADLIAKQDVSQLQYRLRGELLRKHWGLGGTDDAMTRENPIARRELHRYMDTVCDALGLIARGAQQEESLDFAMRVNLLRTRTNFFSETLHSFGRSALLLSGGARLGLMHLGVVKTLRDQKLLPRVISGASAGSIVCAMLGVYRDDELDEKLFDPANINLRFFAVMGEDERANKTPEQRSKELESSSTILRNLLLLLPPPLPDMISAMNQVLPLWANQGTLLDAKVLAATIRASTGDLTFLEAFERTGRIINITVSPSGDRDFPLLLNYLTSPRVLLWSASVASSAIPGVFGAVELLAKDMDGNIVPYFPEGLKWSDGSVESDLPMQRLSELFNVNHFVVSQVNPHARLLAPMQLGPRLLVERGPARQAWHELMVTAESTTKIVVDFCRDQVRSSVKHFATALLVMSPVFPMIGPLRTLGKSMVPILTQKYSGDITIMPALTMHRLVNIMSNPSPEDYLDDLMGGARATWPHVSRIRLHLAIEMILDDCRQSCRRQLARMEEKLMSDSVSPRASTLSGGGGGGGLSTALEKKLNANRAIPTASVLNLSELDVGAPGIPLAQSLPKTRIASEDRPRSGSGGDRPRSGSLMERQRSGSIERRNSGLTSVLNRNSSFVNLSSKLKSRITSFADFADALQEAEEGSAAEREEPESGVPEHGADDAPKMEEVD